MTHIEGVLKEFTLDETGRTIIFTANGYNGQIYEFGISTEELLKKTILREKFSLFISEEGNDTVSIRGIAKNLELTAKYSGNI